MKGWSWFWWALSEIQGGKVEVVGSKLVLVFKTL
jgi:hypothetical protein